MHVHILCVHASCFIQPVHLDKELGLEPARRLVLRVKGAARAQRVHLGNVIVLVAIVKKKSVSKYDLMITFQREKGNTQR